MARGARVHANGRTKSQLKQCSQAKQHMAQRHALAKSFYQRRVCRHRFRGANAVAASRHGGGGASAAWWCGGVAARENRQSSRYPQQQWVGATPAEQAQEHPTVGCFGGTIVERVPQLLRDGVHMLPRVMQLVETDPCHQEQHAAKVGASCRKRVAV